MARRSTGRGHVGKKRQRVEWTLSVAPATFAVGANSSSVLTSSPSLTLAIDQMTSPTLIRTRGELYIQATGSDDQEVLVGAGVCVVSTRAADVGVTAIPRPISEGDYSWLWHKFIFLKVKGSTDTKGPVAAVIRVEVDSKAMRKVLSTEEEIAFAVETNNAAGTAGILWTASFRVLLKES